MIGGRRSRRKTKKFDIGYPKFFRNISIQIKRKNLIKDVLDIVINHNLYWVEPIMSNQPILSQNLDLV